MTSEEQATQPHGGHEKEIEMQTQMNQNITAPMVLRRGAAASARRKSIAELLNDLRVTDPVWAACFDDAHLSVTASADLMTVLELIATAPGGPNGRLAGFVEGQQLIYHEGKAMESIDQAPETVRPLIKPVMTAEQIQQLRTDQKRRTQEGTQLVATIKKSSKYYGQGAKGARFPVSIQSDSCGYVVLGGPGGQYRLADVHLFAVVGNSQVKLT